jgi:hypothetical protein
MMEKFRERLTSPAMLFASYLPELRKAAWRLGYAIAIHGSMNRDMDLVAVPWDEWAVPHDELAAGLAKAVNSMIRTEPTQGLYGRIGYVIPLNGVYYIDLSVMPRGS